MESVRIFVGLDYHSGSVQACVVDAAGKVLLNSKRASSVPDIVSVVESLGHVQRVAIEACCGAADFGDHIALGLRLGARQEHELQLRVEHFSNAGLRKPNPGENFGQVRYVWRF